MLVFRDLKVCHMERDKTYLDQARVGNPHCAFQKARNRILFVKKHANTWQKIMFYTIGLRGNSVRLLAKILKHGGKQRRKIFRAFLRGMRNGIFSLVIASKENISLM